MKQTISLKAPTTVAPAPVQKSKKIAAKPDAFGKFVAAKVKLAAPAPVQAPTITTNPAPVRAEHNGRKEYTPGTIGDTIWKVADALQASTPNMPVTSTAVRIALPKVAPASVSAGLSHWRKFHGTLRVKGASV